MDFFFFYILKHGGIGELFYKSDAYFNFYRNGNRYIKAMVYDHHTLKQLALTVQTYMINTSYATIGIFEPISIAFTILYRNTIKSLY